MTAKTQVGIVDHDPKSSALETRLASLGCTTFSIKSNRPLEESLDAHDPHVIVVRGWSSRAAALDSVRDLRRHEATSGTPIILLTPTADGSPSRDALEAGASSVLTGDFPDIELYTRMRALARLKIMQSELERREDIVRRYGLSSRLKSAKPVDDKRTSIMAIGAFGDDTGKLKSAAGPAHLTFAANPPAGVQALYDGDFDAVVVSTTSPGGEWLTICDNIRDNSRLANLPILLIADGAAFADPARVYERGASDLLIRPFEAAELGGRLDMLIRQQQLYRRMRASYRNSLNPETGDALTGLYSFGYLHDYLASLANAADRWDKDLTVTWFDVIGMSEINRRYGYAGGDRLLGQLGRLMGNLVRGEDLTARCGGDEFCIVTPETPPEEARVAFRRVIGVVEQTEFGISAAEAPVSVQLGIGCAAFKPGETPETLLARARAAVA